MQLICDIAPEADPATAHDQVDIREAFDLDSMDFINLVTAIHEPTKINIPESDYNKIFVLKNAVAYLRDALARVLPKASATSQRETTRKLSMTSLTPGAAHAMRRAAARSVHEWTLPLRMTVRS